MLSDLASFASGEIRLFSIGSNSTMVQALTANASSASFKGFITAFGTTYDFVAMAGSNEGIYMGRINSNGTVSSLVKFSGTSQL